MFGRRPEGRRVKHLDPIVQVTPYLMPMRCDAQVFLSHKLDYDVLMRYIADKSRNEGVKITFMEILVAAFVRGISQVPECNRFISNKQTYNRTELTCALTMLVDTPDGSLEETAVKFFFDPSDTIYDVSRRIKTVVAQNRRPEDANFAMKLAGFALKLPLMPNILKGLLCALDRYGLMPKSLMDALPFHTSMFVTNMASIGMHNVYHHIYNFGNTTLFFSLGSPERSLAMGKDGKVVRRVYLPVGITADERICGGSTFAKLFTVMKQCLSHPELMETPPETVHYAPGCEYHVPKPGVPAENAKDAPAAAAPAETAQAAPAPAAPAEA